MRSDPFAYGVDNNSDDELTLRNAEDIRAPSAPESVDSVKLSLALPLPFLHLPDERMTAGGMESAYYTCVSSLLHRHIDSAIAILRRLDILLHPDGLVRSYNLKKRNALTPEDVLYVEILRRRAAIIVQEYMLHLDGEHVFQAAFVDGSLISCGRRYGLTIVIKLLLAHAISRLNHWDFRRAYGF